MSRYLFPARQDDTEQQSVLDGPLAERLLSDRQTRRRRSPAEIVAASIKYTPKSMEKLRRADEEEAARLRKEREEAGPTRIWLDDDPVYRAAPEGWLQVTTAWAAIAWLDTGNVLALSLDYDLGDDERFGRGIDVVNFLGEQQEVYDRPLWPEEGIALHSANAYGRDMMARAIRADAGRRFDVVESWTPGGKPRFLFEAKERS